MPNKLTQTALASEEPLVFCGLYVSRLSAPHVTLPQKSEPLKSRKIQHDISPISSIETTLYELGLAASIAFTIAATLF